jgi:hypothetical protein
MNLGETPNSCGGVLGRGFQSITRTRVVRVLWSTPGRTFYLYPTIVICFETFRRGYVEAPILYYLPFLAWGYLQFRLTRTYQKRMKSGSRGLGVIPTYLLKNGPYSFTRNPMYLGHLIFLLGLALSFWSWIGFAIFLVNLVWFHKRVLRDEALLRMHFGEEHTNYCDRVHRWIPFLF